MDEYAGPGGGGWRGRGEARGRGGRAENPNVAGKRLKISVFTSFLALHCAFVRTLRRAVFVILEYTRKISESALKFGIAFHISEFSHKSPNA
jgi:hypothetical protein